MTRITNFGIKRTYLQAGFDEDGTTEPGTSNSHSKELVDQKKANSDAKETTVNEDVGAEARPRKKKRIRTPKSKRDGYAAQKAAEAAKLNGEVPPAAEGDEQQAGSDATGNAQKSVTNESKPYETLSKSAKKKRREKDRKAKILKAKEAKEKEHKEAKSMPRVSSKAKKTVCFACREMGHAAIDCPTTKESEKGQGSVGLCYRCGSTQHSLSRCRKPANPADPFPFASCFVCNGKGHLASACPQNKKGLYPNGGCCKLCGETSHLAKDCGVREKITDATTVFGTGREVGPDEDDFHSFKRKTTEIEHEEKRESRLKDMLEVKAGLHSGVVKAYGGVAPPPKKVVIFKG